MDDAFAEAFVSNPASGELVKGHAVVLAELGLYPYAGKVVRSSQLFEGAWARERRAKHIVMRLAFMRALWSRIPARDLPLFRAIASDGVLEQRRPSSFVSATFSSAVALDHFRGGPTTRSAVIFRQPVPAERLFMTFLETRALNRQFKEAEAVLIGNLDSTIF